MRVLLLFRGAHEDCPMFNLYACYYDSIESAEEWLNMRGIAEESQND